MIGKKCLKSLLVFGGIMSVFAFGKTALADEVPVIKGDDGKYDISCIVQAPEGSNWITHYFGKVPFEITSVDEKNPKAKKLYERHDFKVVGQRMISGHLYDHMQKNI